MIYTYSVLKGYQAMLGNTVLHLAIAFTSLYYVSVPKGLGAAIDESLEVLYLAQMIIHFISAIVFLL